MIEFVRKSKAHLFVRSLDDRIEITGDDFHHLSRVLRLANKDLISCASDGLVRQYLIENISREQISAIAITMAQTLNEESITLLVSIFKLDRLELGIAKAVELGVSKIVVGHSERSSISLDAKKREKFLRRTESIIRNSAMQSRRSLIPKIEFTQNIIEYAKKLEGPVVFCEPSGGTKSPVNPSSVLIGPEGGFSEGELLELHSFAQSWNISPYILRAETALMTVPALLNSNPAKI